MNNKLYLVTRADLSHGQQASQLVHGTVSFALEHKKLFKEWQRSSNVIVCLNVNNEVELEFLRSKAQSLNKTIEGGYAFSCFREPFMKHSLTCVVLEPTTTSKELCLGLKLACNDK